jgi:3-hydroxyisobutyrate dehydrogenase-like beta-hydroxyacid dehydrogenase
VRVAILGTGRMGSAMAGTLAREGFDLFLHNRTREKAEEIAATIDGEVADSPAEAVADAEVVLSILADREAVNATFSGEDGATSGLSEGTVVCEMSTVQPEVSRALAAPIRDRGADIIDAPVSGSVPAVEQGSLTIMVGGRQVSLETAMPVLEALSERVFHMGDLGNGAAIKLAVNAVVHAINEALSEALVLAERAGIDRSRAYDVFASSAAAAPFVHYKRQAFEDPDGAPVAFTLDLVRKDLELVLGLADQLDLPMRQAATNHEVARAAAEELGQRDMSAVAEYLRGRTVS